MRRPQARRRAPGAARRAREGRAGWFEKVTSAAPLQRVSPRPRRFRCATARNTPRYARINTLLRRFQPRWRALVMRRGSAAWRFSPGSWLPAATPPRRRGAALCTPASATNAPLPNSQAAPYVRLSPEVAAALAAHRPVVALESTIISHGMPYPANLNTAREVEAAVRAAGAVPATVAVLAGQPCVGATHVCRARSVEIRPAVTSISAH